MESSLNPPEEPEVADEVMPRLQTPGPLPSSPPPPARSSRNRMAGFKFPSLPVQLTWKGVEIYINSRVVLTTDLKERADEALRQKILRESTPSDLPNVDHRQAVPSDPADITESNVEENNSSKTSAGPSPKTKWKIKGTIAATTSSASEKHTCKVCGREFKYSHLVKRHMKVHSMGKGKGKRNYGPCVKCGARFQSSSGLAKHLKSCTVGNSSNLPLPIATKIKIEKTDEDMDIEHEDDNFVDDNTAEEEDAMVGENSESAENETLNDGTPIQPKVDKAWGDIFLKKLEEKQQPLTLDSDALKAKLEEKLLANLRNGLSDQSEADNEAHGSTGLEYNENGYMKCRECGSPFTSSKEYRMHTSRCVMMSQPTTTDGRSREHHCTVCPWKFTTVYSLQRHVVQTHTNSTTEEFKCLECQSIFNNQQDLQLHSKTCGETAVENPTPGDPEHPSPQSQVHESGGTGKRFSCDICHRTFSSPNHLRQHARSHMGNSSLVISNVSGGGIGIDLPSQPQQEVVTQVNKNKTNRCDTCGHKFSNAANLRRHIRKKCCQIAGSANQNTSFFNKKHKFCCFICGKKFQWNSKLIRHIRTHQTQSLKCEKCEETFNSNSLLNQHALTECHKKNLEKEMELPEESQEELDVPLPSFKCDACGKTFTDKLALSRHCLSHVLGGFTEVSEVNVPQQSSTSKAGPASSKLSNKSKTRPKQTRSHTVPTPPIVPLPIPTTSTAVTAGLVYSCKYKNCSHGFSHDEDLWYHIEKKHKCLDDLCCNFCGQDCDSEAAMSLHKKSVHGIEKVKQQDSDSHTNNIGSFKVEAPEDVHFEDDFHDDNQDDYHQSQDDSGEEEDYAASSTAVTALEKLKAEILRKDKKTYVLISEKDKAAAEEAMNSLHSNNYDSESESLEEEGNGESYRLDIPIQDYYTCIDCGKVFDNRLRYIAHLNYHAFIKKRGIEWSGKRSNKGIGLIFGKPVPVQDLYTCDRCPVLREFTSRRAFISHTQYHEIMKKKGREWAIGRTPKGRKSDTEVVYKKFVSDDVPYMDVYACDFPACNNKEFADRAAYINHLKYHDYMKRHGREAGIGKSGKSKRGKVARVSEVIPENIPHMDIYTCKFPTCDNKEFDDRKAYIGHLRYHETMRRQGREWIIGTTRKGKSSRDDIPIMDVYTCDFPTCNNRTFPDRSSYVAHFKYHERMREMGREWAIGLKKGHTLMFDRIPIQDEYTCSQCEDQKVFIQRDAYFAHLESHEQARKRMINTGKKWKQTRVRSDIPFQDIYTCEICEDRTFTNRTSFINHKTYHRSLSKQGFSNRRIATLGNHPRTKRRPDIPYLDVYTCKYCPQTNSDRAAHIRHIYYHEVIHPKIVLEKEMKHQEIQPGGSGAAVPIQYVYRCKLCTTEIKTFTDRSKYLQHLSYHKAKKRQLDNEFEMDQELPDDRDDIPHQEVYMCQICGEEKSFTQRSAYLRHLKCHKTMRALLYQCSVCEKAFSSAWNLSSHAKTHTGEKNFVCGDCGKRFSSKQSLQKHQTICRKTPCPYSCHCGDKFHSVQFLEVHVKRYHSKDRPTEPKTKKFRCYVCDQEFIQAFELNNHVKNLHPEDYKEFMQQKAVSEAVAAFAESQQEEDEQHDVTQFIPEIIMKSEDVEMPSPNEATVTSVSPELSEADDEPSGDGVPLAEAPSWNFMPFLENMDDTNDDEEEVQFYQEFLPETFEPEDVELQGCTPTPISLPENSTTSVETTNRPTVVGNPKQPTINNYTPPIQSHQCGYCKKTSHKEQFIKQHCNYKHKGLPHKVIELPISADPKTGIFNAVRKILDTYKNDSNKASKPQSQNPDATRYKCYYCDKKSSQPRFIKSHHDHVHRGLQFKAIDLFNPEKDTEVPSTSSRRGSMLGRLLEAPPTVLTPYTTVSSSGQTSEQQQVPPRRSSKDAANPPTSNTRAGPKSKLKCQCCVSDTALGHLKRCVGNDCPCYSNTKGCSDECRCNGICSNPYFRNSKPPLPDLVPVSVLPLYNRDAAPNPPVHNISNNNNNNTSLRSQTGIQYELRIMETATQSSSSNMYDLDKLYWDTVNSSELSSSSSIPQQQTPGNIAPSISANSVMSLSQPMIQTVPALQSMQPEEPQRNEEVVVNHVFNCNYCPEGFESLSSYVTHQWIHNNCKSFQCPVPTCKKRFGVISHLVLHSRNHVQVFNCTACSATFEVESEMEKHFQEIHSPQNCNICNIEFPSKTALTEHQKKDHCHCNICDTVFTKDFYLKRHQFNIHGITANSDQTSASFSSSPSLNVHTKTVDPEVIDLNLEEEDVIEYTMPVIVNSSSIAMTPIPMEHVPHQIDFSQIIENFQVD